MATFLFDEIIFGPVKSRRLGLSLGINLLPASVKVCNFNCIYCECGLTGDIDKTSRNLPSRKDVYEALDLKLSEMKSTNKYPDVITYAGNGEPTLHPDFPGIIDDSLTLRDKYFPTTDIAVLSNASMIDDPQVKLALMKVDRNILKLDSVFNATIRIHNQPRVRIDAGKLIDDLAGFNGKLVIQTLFLKGSFKGKVIDNTTPAEVNGWLEAIRKINPSEVMIYTISRDTPYGGQLKKVAVSELRRIAALVERNGIKTQISG